MKPGRVNKNKDVLVDKNQTYDNYIFKMQSTSNERIDKNWMITIHSDSE